LNENRALIFFSLFLSRRQAHMALRKYTSTSRYQFIGDCVCARNDRIREVTSANRQETELR